MRGGVYRLRSHPVMTLTSATDQRSTDSLADAVERAASALARHQHADGHWLFELEADATIPAEYVLLEHLLDRIDPPLQAKIGVRRLSRKRRERSSNR